MVRVLPLLLVLMFEIFCVVDIVQTPSDQARGLPKVGWLLLVLFFPIIGGVAWLVAGRPHGTPARSAYDRSVPDFPEYDRPGRAAGISPESDAEFLRKIRERAEEQRRKAAEQKREAERKAAEADEPDAER